MTQTTSLTGATTRVSETIIDQVREVIKRATQPISASEIRQALDLTHRNSPHVTTIYIALRVLSERNEVWSRIETAEEQILRNSTAPRRASLYWSNPNVPKRVSQHATVDGYPLRVSSTAYPKKSKKKNSRPAKEKNVQTGHEIQNSRPALDPDVQTGYIREIDRLSNRVAELELTLEMFRRLLDSLDKS